MTTLPELEFELSTKHGPKSGPDQLWELRCPDPFGEEPDRVLVHRSQIWLIAERMDLVPVVDADAGRTIARLSRQLHILSDRIDRMHDKMLGIAERGHESVDEELAFAEASYELASEFVSQLTCREINTPETGAVTGGNPPKSGPVDTSYPPKSGAIPDQQQLPLATSPTGGQP